MQRNGDTKDRALLILLASLVIFVGIVLFILDLKANRDSVDNMISEIKNNETNVGDEQKEDKEGFVHLDR